MILDELVTKFPKAKRQSDGSFLVQCPSHKDRTPSLHISQADDRILLKCHAGCDTEAICQALGIELSDLFLESTKQASPGAKKIIATYDYKDEQGHLLFQVVRYEPKSFAQRHKNSTGEWVWNLDGVRRILYHLPEISERLGAEDMVYIVEGEKDCDKLWEWGQVATTSPGGANNWKPEYAELLRGRKVVIIPDKDAAGYAYARNVANSLRGKAKDVKCILLPGDDVKDFSDWIIDGDVADLPSLEQDISILFNLSRPEYQQEEDAIVWHKNIKGQDIIFEAAFIRQERTGIHARISIGLDYQPLAWSLFNIERSDERIRLANQASVNLKIEGYGKEDLRRDLDLFCAGLWEFSLSSFAPELMVGEETKELPRFYLYPYIIEGGGSILFSPPGRGKSNTALVWAVSVDAGISSLWKVIKTPVLFINLERAGQSLRRRLANVNSILGLPINRPLLTFNARGKSLADIAPAIRIAIKQYGVGLIILDSISRAGYGDLTENRPVNTIIDALSGLCETWLALGHTPRASEEHLFGSIMADAGADIVIQLRSQVVEDKLGIGFEITKSNDLPQFPQNVFAFEFADWKLVNVRPAKPFEFPDIEAKAKTNMLTVVKDFILGQDEAIATATQIEDGTGYSRPAIAKLLKAPDFVKRQKQGRNQFYGVSEKNV